jgi:hypothetical protein
LRAVPNHDAELITCTYTYNPEIKRSIIVKKISMLAAVVFLLGAMAQSALAQNLATFKGGIGDITTGSTATSVFNIAAAGQIWVIRDLTAEVRVDGMITVNGQGLLLGAGNGIGSNAGASVFATLFCANDGNIPHSTNAAGVALQVNGDFRIQDSVLPAPPTTCTSPVLLIRNTSGVWFAAGIPFLIPSHPLPPVGPPQSH